jgi:cytochrome c peroxidase
MRRKILIGFAAACATIAGAMSFSIHIVHGQTTPTAPTGPTAPFSPFSPLSPFPPPVPPGPIYNPYPPGILPADIESELARVVFEVDTLESRAIARWKAMVPPTVTNQPPILQNTGTEAVETLGELMNYDRNISPKRDIACASCHLPYVAFSGPIPSVNLTMIAYPGTEHFRANKRTAQRYTYAPFFPVLIYNLTQGLFYGGNFWDSRATGYLIRSPDAEQAQGPPVDTGEMGNPDTACVTYKLSLAAYRPLFEEVWGADSFDIEWPSDTAGICATPGGATIFGPNTQPVSLSAADRTKSNNVYNHWGQALDAYEASTEVSPFSSKFDAFLKGTYTLTSDEAAGFALFNGKGNCNSCHVNGRGTALTANMTDNTDEASVKPLFTCFGSANEGLPLNPADAFYYQTTPDPFGFIGNPYGFGYRDLGLGTFLRSGFGSYANPNITWRQYAPTADGQMQVATARNVGMAPPQCPTTEAPGPYFQKEFFHNGYIKSLKQLVHFYNTRDVPGIGLRTGVTSGHCPAGTTERVDCWPEPEVPNNIDMTTGKLGLTDTEENQIVIFMQTLTDGFTVPYPNNDVYTGQCMTGGTAATQGNTSLIPTPPLPPCASVICDVAPLPTKPIP